MPRGAGLRAVHVLFNDLQAYTGRMPIPRNAHTDPFVTHCLELLAPLGIVRSRAMFGGHGLYVDDLFVALIAFERLYLKTDAHSQPRFEQAGCEPFVYDGKNGSISMGYWTMPPEAMDSSALAGPWARLALEAALRARAAKATPRSRKRPAADSSSEAPGKGVKPRKSATPAKGAGSAKRHSS